MVNAFEAVTDLCRRLGFDVGDIRGRSRLREHVDRRRLVALTLRPLFSLPELGRGMGRHHTTVLALLQGGKGRVKRYSLRLDPGVGL
jgi:chromosomal replication initiation ATPase DnaA